jgi:hypothetical protein
VRLFKKSKAFYRFDLIKTFKEKLRLFPVMCVVREVEAFYYKCEAFIKTTMLFEDIYREIEALIRNLRLFKDFENIFNRIEAF